FRDSLALEIERQALDSPGTKVPSSNDALRSDATKRLGHVCRLLGIGQVILIQRSPYLAHPFYHVSAANETAAKEKREPGMAQKTPIADTKVRPYKMLEPIEHHSPIAQW